MTTYIPSITLPQQIFASPVASMLLPVVTGAAIGFATSPRNTQRTYMALKQPPFRPPPWVFGPAWTTLYTLMGYAAWRAWATGTASVNPVVRDMAQHGATLYTIQLALNFIWMPLFFSWRKPLIAAVDILSLLGVSSYMTYIWGQVDQRAGYALVPYLAWLSFASYLNIGVGVLNDWEIDEKERTMPPGGPKDKDKFINEKDK